jgi:hypothetical protein
VDAEIGAAPKEARVRAARHTAARRRRPRPHASRWLSGCLKGDAMDDDVRDADGALASRRSSQGDRALRSCPKRARGDDAIARWQRVRRRLGEAVRTD